MINESYEKHCEEHDISDQKYVQGLDLERCYEMAKYGNTFHILPYDNNKLYIGELARRNELEKLYDILFDIEELKDYVSEVIKLANQNDNVQRKGR